MCMGPPGDADRSTRAASGRPFRSPGRRSVQRRRKGTAPGPSRVGTRPSGPARPAGVQPASLPAQPASVSSSVQDGERSSEPERECPPFRRVRSDNNVAGSSKSGGRKAQSAVRLARCPSTGGRRREFREAESATTRRGAEGASGRCPKDEGAGESAASCELGRDLPPTSGNRAGFAQSKSSPHGRDHARAAAKPRGMRRRVGRCLRAMEARRRRCPAKLDHIQPAAFLPLLVRPASIEFRSCC